jgi:hypothetical protein
MQDCFSCLKHIDVVAMLIYLSVTKYFIEENVHPVPSWLCLWMMGLIESPLLLLYAPPAADRLDLVQLPPPPLPNNRCRN